LGPQNAKILEIQSKSSKAGHFKSLNPAACNNTQLLLLLLLFLLLLLLSLLLLLLLLLLYMCLLLLWPLSTAQMRVNSALKFASTGSIQHLDEAFVLSFYVCFCLHSDARLDAA